MLIRRLALDLAPSVLFRALAQKERSFFVDAGRPWGDERVSCMGFRPRMQLRIDARAGGAGVLGALDHVLAAVAPPARVPRRDDRPPFAGGAVVALAYEAKSEIERLPQRQEEEADAPRLLCNVYDAAVAYDHRRRRYCVASWHLDARALAHYAEEVEDAAAEARRRATARADGGADATVRMTANFRADGHAAAVARIQRLIAAGDVYQVNLSMRFEAPLPCAPDLLYARLRAVQPVPFGGYYDFGREQILSNSPELFLRRRGDRITTCPIKGTRPRAATADRDRQLAAELGRDPKERAEHVMIVDLERNDLGRICLPGSVRVTRFAEPLRLRTIRHLVSTVEGTLRPGLGASDVLRATFPGGSITGAPKIRAMEIIDELERGPRGIYTGALGWIDAGGDCDLSIPIRTATVRAGRLRYHAGSGIVADSDPAREHAECLLKAAAFFRALDGGEARPAARAAAPPAPV